MIAVDTSVWVRYVTNDDPEQGKRTLDVLSRPGGVFVPKTVLLELEWVLRAAYDLPAKAIGKALFHVIGLPDVQVETPDQVAMAMDLFTKGMDFADALHLASIPCDVPLCTFDADFVKKAGAVGAAVEKI